MDQGCDHLRTFLGSSIFCVHSLWMKLNVRFLLLGCHGAAAQEIETGVTVHGAPDDFEPAGLFLDRTSASGQR
jgi:hypothetical protein